MPLTHEDVRRLFDNSGEPLLRWIDFLSPNEVDVEGEPESLVLLREGRRLMVLKHDEGRCHFLSPHRGCTVHSHRPAACRTYPFDRPDEKFALRLGVVPGAICPENTGVEAQIVHEQQDGIQGHPWELRPFSWEVQRRDGALHRYAELVRLWNARQRTRIRLGRLPESQEQFLEFLRGAADPAEPANEENA